MRGRLAALLLLAAVAVLTIVSALVEKNWGISPAPAQSPAQTPPMITLPADLPAVPTAPAGSDTERALNYFEELAFSSEYGTSSGKIVKWTKPLLICPWGEPTPEDLATLDGLIGALNQVSGMPEVKRVDSGGNLRIAFVPRSKLKKVIPGYVGGNWGYMWLQPAADGSVDRAEVGIASDVTNQLQRNHLILEETTQALGLPADSLRYEDSIFYGLWTETQQLSELDWSVLRLLYSPRVLPGMTPDQARAVLRP